MPVNLTMFTVQIELTPIFRIYLSHAGIHKSGEKIMTRLKKIFAVTLFSTASIIAGCSAKNSNALLSGKNEGSIKKELQICLGQAALLEKTGSEKYNL